MSAYFDALERELRAAVPRAGSAPPRSRRVIAGLVPAVAAAVAVAVAVVALTIGGRSGHAGLAGHRGPGAAQPPAMAIPTLAQLRANFAVLRRPQTAADRAWREPHGLVSPRARPGLTREARRFGSERVFLTVDPPRSRRNAPASSLMTIWLVQDDGHTTSENFGPNVNYNALPLMSGRLIDPPQANTWVEAVPDGTASVRWTFTCGRRTLSAPPCPARRLFTITVPVRDNVAIARVPYTGECPRCAQPVATLWFDARAAVIFQYDGQHNLTRPPFVPPAGPRRVLGATSVAGVRFGISPNDAQAALAPMLGPAQVVSVAHSCQTDATVTWSPYGRGPRAPLAGPLNLYFRRGRLVGYRYGSRRAPIGIGPVIDPRSGRIVNNGAILQTARGLRIGQPLATGNALYGRRFQFNGAHGGNWSVLVSRGPLRGLTAPTGSPVGPRSTIATVEAGDTGCLSP